jgi:integrase
MNEPARPLRLSVVAGDGDAVDAAYASDIWRAADLGVVARRGRDSAWFTSIKQAWLRDSVKDWCRFRLSTGAAFGTITTMAQGIARFSEFLDERHPDIIHMTGVTRVVLEDYLSWMASSPWKTSVRSLTLTMLRGFLEWGHRYGELPGLANSTVLYVEEVTRPEDPLPRFVPEFIMAQLESDANLDQLPSPSVRNLVVLLMETGLRGGDACQLAFNPLIDDSVGWPCLRFSNSKMGSEQLIPLSAKAAETIRAQQDHVRERCPDGSPWLFPGIEKNVDGKLPYAHGSLSGQLGSWQRRIGVHDETGQAVRIQAHQFRHTVGTRLINAGVPQHVVQKLLGHASPRMTARYATIHDHTVRDAFQEFCRQRINTAGEHLDYEPDALTAEAEWVKHNLSRVRDTLPNGYCGRPPQQDCPHPNACLTCPDFQTTPEFLSIHRKQADSNRRLIARADADGHFRLGENLRKVQASLECIIPALEALENGPPT